MLVYNGADVARRRIIYRLSRFQPVDELRHLLAVERLFAPVPVLAGPMLAVAIAGLVVNILVAARPMS